MLSSQVPFNVTCDQAFIILMVAVSERKNKSLIEVSLKFVPYNSISVVRKNDAILQPKYKDLPTNVSVICFEFL